MFLYVYMHIDPRTDAVRYVGIGSLSRAYGFQERTKDHIAWIAELDAQELEPRVALPTRTRDREEAYEVERALIKWHRERGSPLFNMAAGGIGASGLVMSAERRKQIGAVNKAKWLFDPDFRKRRLPDLIKARAARNRSPEQIAAVTKHAQINGSPCRKCGGTLRYKTSRNCVNCARRS